MADIKWAELSGSSTGGGTRWDYEHNKVMIGTYKGVEEGVGAFKSNVYHFDHEGEIVDVWGTTALNLEMKRLLESGEIEVGDMLKIEYLGEQKNPNTGRTFKNFKVYKAV